ncbi:MAG: magnesium transporter CorA family protein [archaeon]|nr:magnesium transporter CorA family protein [archaeon]
MALKAYSLNKNRVVENEFEKLSLKSPLTWVRAVNPTASELKSLSRIIEVDKDVFEDCLDESERSRVESEEHVRIIYRAPFYEEGDVVTSAVGFIIKKNIVISVCRKKGESVDCLAKILSGGRGKFMFANGTYGIVFKIIETMNEKYLNVINRIADTSDIIEENIFKINKEYVQKLLSINTTLAYFHNSLAANLEVMKILRKGYTKQFRGEMCVELFDDLYFDVMELIDNVKIQRDIINNLFEMQSTIVSNELNVVMKKITAIAAVIMVPTLITGIYGMNFSHMPFADYIYGFYIIIGIILFTIISLVLYFRYLKWL